MSTNKNLAVPQPPAKSKPDIEHHLKEWSSGKRGGGKVPPDFGWRTNPKQNQEENGANAPRHRLA